MVKKANHDDCMLTEEMFDQAVVRFKKKNKPCYNLLTKAGNMFRQSLFKLFEVIWEKEVVPSAWDLTTLTQIYKGKGPAEKLDNNRFIHSKQWMPKLFEGIVVEAMKPEINSTMSKFQIGGCAGHRPQELIFVVRSIIQLYQLMNIALIIMCWDIQKFFDKENLRDGMNSLHTANVNKKLYRLWYLLNANIKIRVSTGLGYTPWKEVGQCLGQGSLGGALVSAHNLGSDFDEYFEESTEEVFYGSVRLQPMLFQDDAIRLATTRNNAQSGNLRVESIMKSKLLEIHPDKSCYLLVADKTNYELIQNEINDNPFVYHDFHIKQKSQEKWLGDQLHEQGLSATNLATVMNRRGKVLSLIHI